MPAPIAEIPQPAPRRARTQPPKSLAIVILLSLIFGAIDMILTLVFPVRYFPTISIIWEHALFLSAMGLLQFLPLLLLWRGANWARWLVIAVNVLTFASVLMPDDSVSLPLVREIMNWLYIPYSLGMIIFLLTPTMQRHFAGASD